MSRRFQHLYYDRRASLCISKELLLGRPQASFSKRQREQAKRDRQKVKAEKRTLRKDGEGQSDDGVAMEDMVMETPIDDLPLE